MNDPAKSRRRIVTLVFRIEPTLKPLVELRRHRQIVVDGHDVPPKSFDTERHPTEHTAKGSELKYVFWLEQNGFNAVVIFNKVDARKSSMKGGRFWDQEFDFGVSARGILLLALNKNLELIDVVVSNSFDESQQVHDRVRLARHLDRRNVRSGPRAEFRAG